MLDKKRKFTIIIFYILFLLLFLYKNVTLQLNVEIINRFFFISWIKNFRYYLLYLNVEIINRFYTNNFSINIIRMISTRCALCVIQVRTCMSSASVSYHQRLLLTFQPGIYLQIQLTLKKKIMQISYRSNIDGGRVDYLVVQTKTVVKFCLVHRWLPEIRRHSPDTPVLIVGTQSDLRSDVKVINSTTNSLRKCVYERVWHFVRVYNNCPCCLIYCGKKKQLLLESRIICKS